ncbi:MAG TPA: GNAT family N-acetyltransferase [Symbiobacteriaceae bacterium]|nr:GNAT family N-acetyltransferase [Symbiobacteriaceae bacterium]
MYSFRYVHPTDLSWLGQATVLSAHESLTPEERHRANPQAVAQLAWQELQHVLGDPGGMAIMATAWNQPVGFLLAAVNPDSSTDEMNGALLSLWVAPAHRRRGLGKTLLRLGEDLCLRSGLRKMKIVAGLHNQAAVHMARRAGYAPEGLIGIKSL